MKKRIRFITFIIMGLTVSLYSQDYKSIFDSMQGAKFADIIEVIEQQWEGKYQGKHSGRKQYERWKYYCSARVDENGYLPDLSIEKWETFYNDNKSTKFKSTAGSFRGNWESLAPLGHDLYGPNWAEWANAGSGRVNCIAVDPADTNIIYVGTPGGGLWRTINGGASWDPLIDGMPRLGVSDIVIIPSSPENNRTIYILTGDDDSWDTPGIGVLVSTDNGVSWNSTALGADEVMYGYCLEMHPTDHNTLYAASYFKGIYKTTDGGLTWTLTDIDRVADMKFKPGDPNTMYITTRRGTAYKSTDAGENWVSMDIGDAAGAGWILLSVTPDAPEYVYLYATIDPTNSGSRGSTFLSTNSGGSFSLQSVNPAGMGNPQNFYNLAFIVSPNDKDELHLGGVNPWKSYDGGLTWKSSNQSDNGEYSGMHADIHTYEYVGNTVYCGNDGGIYYSSNRGNNWHNINSNLDIKQYYRLGLITNRSEAVLAGAQDNGTQIVENQTNYHSGGGDGMNCFSDPVDENIMYTETQNGRLYKSTDRGIIWQVITPPGESGKWVTEYIMDPTNSNVLYAGYDDVYRSTDAGATWTNISGGQLDDPSDVSFIAVAPSDPNCIYATKNRLFKSNDGGVTWIRPNDAYSIDGDGARPVVHPTNKNIVWTAGHSNSVMKTEDGGLTWTNIKYNLPDYQVNTIVYQEGSNDRIYVGTDIGVYFLDNSSTSWTEFSDGLVNVEVTELEIDYFNGKLVASTYGRGVWISDLYIDCYDGSTITIPTPATPSLKSAAVPSTPIVVEAESLTGTGGTYNDAYAGGPGLGVNNSGTGINYVNTGDWAEYNVPASLDAGVYKIEYDISTPSNNAQIQFDLDGTIISTDDVPNNGQWDVYGLIEASQNLTYYGGGSTIKLTATGTNDWQWNLDNFVLTKISDIQVDVTGVTVAPSTSSIEEGQTVQLTETVEPSTATNKNVSWSSNNTAIATVDANGLVTAVSEGNAVITVTTEQGSYTATSSITVTPAHIPVIGVNVTPVSYSLEEGNTVQLNESVQPTDATNKNVSWSSNNTSVATVDSEGLVSAIAEGNATITVTTEEGSFKASCSIEVTNGDNIPVTSLEPVGDTLISLRPNSSNILECILTPMNATNPNISWSTDNTDLITFYSQYYNPNTGRASIHVVTGEELGNVVVTATAHDGGYTVNYYLTIEKEPIVVEAEHFSSTGGSNGGFEIFAIGQDTAIKAANINDNAHYSFDVPEGGVYKMRLHVGGIGLSLVDVTVDYKETVNCTIPMTGSYESFDILTLDKEFSLDQGTGYVYFNGTGGPSGVHWSMDKFELIKQRDLSLPVTGIELTDTFEEVQAGQTYQLNAEITPTNATDATVTWTSLDNSIAQVNANGLVTGVACGETSIIATSNDGGFTDTCIIKVPCQTEFVIEAEDFTETGGTVDDSPWGGPGYGVNNAGTNINWVNTGDWAEYSLNIYESGQYQIDYYAGTNQNGAALELSIDGVAYLTDQIPSTGDWDVYELVTASKYFEMQPGTYALQVKGVGTTGWEWNLDKIEIAKVGEVCIPTVNLKSRNTELPGYFAGPMPGLVQESKEIETEGSLSENEDVINIYPNPASAQISVDFKSLNSLPVTIELLNVVGEVQATIVYNEVLPKGNYSMKYDISELEAGIYFVKYQHGSEMKVQNLVIK